MAEIEISDRIDEGGISSISQIRAVNWIGKYFIAIGVLGTCNALWNHLILHNEDVELLFFLVSITIGFALMKDSIAQNESSRVKVAYVFAIWPIYMFLIGDIIFGSVQTVASVCTIYIMVKQPPKALYYLTHVLYMLFTILIAAGLILTVTGISFSE